MKSKTNIKLILTICAICLTVFANAQLRLGPVAGVNLANITGDGDSTNAMKIGFHVGGVVELGITDNFIIAPGLLYTIKGTQDKDESSHKENLSYIEIPVNAKYKMESGLNFFAGPYLGILMSANVKDDSTTTDIKDFVASTDFGFNIGIGFDMESGLGFSAQYGMGLSTIAKAPEGYTGDLPSAKNSCIGISIRYMFGGK